MITILTDSGCLGCSSSSIVGQVVPVCPVVVMHVHEYGHRLAQDDTAPYYDIPQLALEEWDGRYDT